MRCFTRSWPPSVCELLVDSAVVVEACPTSNMTLGFLTYGAHPIQEMRQKFGLDVSLSTDDPSLFHNHISDEYEEILVSVLGGDIGGLIRFAQCRLIDVLRAWTLWTRAGS